jgi:hypothetical protein
MVTAAIVGPGTGAAAANDLHQTPPIAWNATGFEDDCTDVELGAGQVLWHFIQNQTDAASGELTAEFDLAGWVIVDNYKKSGPVLHWAIITGHDTLLSATSDVDSDGNLNLSHICVGPEASEQPSESVQPEESVTPEESVQPEESVEPEESVTPEESVQPEESVEPEESVTPEESVQPEESVTPEESVQPTEEPSESVEPSEEPSESVEPTGSVEAATDEPTVTVPPTDTVTGTSGPINDNWKLILLAFAGVLAATLLMLPAEKATSRTKR